MINVEDTFMAYLDDYIKDHRYEGIDIVAYHNPTKPVISIIVMSDVGTYPIEFDVNKVSEEVQYCFISYDNERQFIRSEWFKLRRNIENTIDMIEQKRSTLKGSANKRHLREKPRHQYA